MHSFQAALALLMAIMANMALAAPGIYVTAMILATTLVEPVVPSGFQHSVVAAPGRTHSRQTFPSRASYATGCFNSSTFAPAAGGNSTLIPWTALADKTDPQSELALFYAFTALCKRMSSTILTRDIPVSRPVVGSTGPPSFPQFVRFLTSTFFSDAYSTPTVSPTSTQTARTASLHR